MHFKPPQQNRDPDLDLFARRIESLRWELHASDLQAAARRTGAEYLVTGERHALSLEVWGQRLNIASPEYHITDDTGKVAPAPLQALVLYYLVTADGSPLSKTWVSFADLPGGRFYAPAFQGNTGNQLLRAFGDDLPGFIQACITLGGVQATLGDAAFVFWPLARLPILANLWQGDEEFPSTYKLLFDASATHYLPIDVCAILGSMLTRRLISAHNQST